MLYSSKESGDKYCISSIICISSFKNNLLVTSCIIFNILSYLSQNIEHVKMNLFCLLKFCNLYHRSFNKIEKIF